MIKPVERNGGAIERSPSSEDARLRKSALQLESLFVQRLFAAMRETVPQDGIIERSGAETTFSTLLDEKIATQVPEQWSGEHSLAEALYRQLRARIEPTVADANLEPSDPTSAQPGNRVTAQPES